MKKNELLLTGAAILLIILLFDSYYSTMLNNKIDKRIEETRESSMPAKIGIISLTTSCKECYDPSNVIRELEKLNVTSEENVEVLSKEGKELIAKYNIQKIPTIIVTGEIGKVSVSGFLNKGDVLVFDSIKPPYIDANTMAIKGKVSMILIQEKDCILCSSLDYVEQNLKKEGVYLKESKVTELSDAKSLVDKYSIKKVPAVLLSDDIEAYEIGNNLKNAGIKNTNGYYAVEGPAPYIEVKTGNIRGLLNMTLINASSCTKCYDVTLHKQIYSQMGLAIVNENNVDINSPEGLLLKSKHNITKVPMVILSGDIDAYEGLDELWKQVGTKSFGDLVFKNVELLGNNIVYMDLSKGKVVGEP